MTPTDKIAASERAEEILRFLEAEREQEARRPPVYRGRRQIQAGLTASGKP